MEKARDTVAQRMGELEDEGVAAEARIEELDAALKVSPGEVKEYQGKLATK